MTDADPAVDLVARATEQHHLVVGEHDADGNCPCCCGDWHEGGDEGWDEHMAAVSVAALADRLLPPVVQTRVEWGRWCVKCNDFDLHRDQRNSLHTHVRTITTLADDGSPYGGATLTGKWRNVDE